MNGMLMAKNGGEMIWNGDVIDVCMYVYIYNGDILMGSEWSYNMGIAW